MLKLITVAVVCVAIITPAEAQTLADAVVAQYGVFKKSNSAVKVCVSEVDRMQEERNGHYETLLHAKAQNPDAPTVDEMSNALAETRAEDAVLNQKRQACTLELDELVATAIELRRNCAAYSVTPNTDNERATAADIR